MRGMKLPARYFKSLVAGLQVMFLGSCYLAAQGYHLVQHQAAATPVERLQKRSAAHGTIVLDEGRESLLFQRVDRIREYGRTEIGLTVGKSFTTYVATEKEYLADVVSATRSDRFERKEWSFPFFGRFPYKGFYRPESAYRLAKMLREERWDVYVRRVDAFSMLGFLREPLYTFMTEYDEARLADLILHEMAHATLWVRNETQFNEQFATFVGRTGARDYLVDRYGPEDAHLIELEVRRADAEVFRTDMLGLRDELAALYTEIHASPAADEGERRSRLLREKEAVIRRFQNEFIATYHERYRSERYLPVAEIPINNAYLDLFSTYTGELHLFEEYHRKRGGTLAETVAALLDLIASRPTGERPIDALRRAL